MVLHCRLCSLSGVPLGARGFRRGCRRFSPDLCCWRCFLIRLGLRVAVLPVIGLSVLGLFSRRRFSSWCRSRETRAYPGVRCFQRHNRANLGPELALGSETPRTTQDWSLHELYVTRLLDLAGHRFVLEFSLSLGSFRIFVSTTERWIRLGLGSAYIVFLRWALVGWSRVQNSQADVLANLRFALETNSQMSIPMLVLQWPATMEEPPSEEVSAVEEGEA
ncbi:hypothetical protein F2Q70_00023144 [Brassica cretica]|uniref:Transmembrane protein n=1 Tax=Brassica cretica TaxID=69181 RepID=A0A8S9GFI4_BRACR|nr:hypothetical protein F2Q70_00023144 [Brassica cretica]